jgi:hypothetical protein
MKCMVICQNNELIKFMLFCVYFVSWDISVGIVTGWMARVQFRASSRDFSLPHPDQLWGPLSLLSNGYLEALSLGVKLTTHLHLVPMSRQVEPHQYGLRHGA